MKRRNAETDRATLEAAYRVHHLAEAIAGNLGMADHLARTVLEEVAAIEEDLKAGRDPKAHLDKLREETVSPINEWESEGAKYLGISDAAGAIIAAYGEDPMAFWKSNEEVLLSMMPDAHTVRATDIETLGGADPIAVRFKDKLFVAAEEIGHHLNGGLERPGEDEDEEAAEGPEPVGPAS